MTERTLTLLPLDILVHIFKYLRIPDLRNVMLTCKCFRELVLNETLLWRYNTQKDLILKCFIDRNLFTYYNRCRISHNWRKGFYKNKIIIQHNTNYMPWLQLHKSKSLLLSTGANLQNYFIDKKGINQSHILWSITVPTVKRDDIRTNDISKFMCKDDFLVCGNRDGCVTIYKFENSRRKPILLAHIEDCHEKGQVEVSDVGILKNVVVTISSNSQSISFWKLDNYIDNSFGCCYNASEILINDILGCRCLASNNSENQLAIGLNGNSKALLLDVTTGTVIMSPLETINNKQVTRDIQWRNDNTFVYVTHAGKLEMVDIRTKNVVYKTEDPFQSSLYCVKTDGENAVVAGSSEYSRCVLYDVRTTCHVQMYFTQKKSSPIYSLDFDTTKLVAAADRGVAALNFNVGTATTKQRDYSHTFEFVSS